MCGKSKTFKKVRYARRRREVQGIQCVNNYCPALPKFALNKSRNGALPEVLSEK